LRCAGSTIQHALKSLSWAVRTSSVLASPAASPALGTKGGSVCRAGFGAEQARRRA
jgi:hypothetical protein